jgi:glycosyltransferase involved in cell wall biosynthesis
MRPLEVIVSSGGIYHAYHTARGAAEAGCLRRFIVGIYNPREKGIDPRLIRKIRLPNWIGQGIQRLPSPNSPYLSYLVRDNLFDLLARRHLAPVDVFHGWNHMSLYSLRRARKLGARIMIERSSTHPVVQERILREEYERFGVPYPGGMRWLMDKHIQEYEEADAIAVPSAFVARTLIEQGVPAEKLRHVHLGFDPARFYPAPKPDSVFRVLFAGLITLRKGIPYLLEAFKRLQLPDAKLVLVGGKAPDSHVFLPPYESSYRHVPFVPQEDLPALYHSGSVFVLPSLEEGFGMVAYEAAACGLPVIVTENVGATIRDGQDGFVVPIRDSDALAERLLRLYEDEDLRQAMGESARQYVQRFTWEAYHQEIVGHYRTLAKK